MQGRHSITDKTQTERTGAYKDRLTRELRRHTWDQIKQLDWGETGSQGAHGEQKHNKTVQGRDITPPSRKVRPRTVEQQRGGGTGRVGTKVEALEEDEHPGGDRLTETREVTKEGAMRRSQRRGVLRRWRVDARPRRSWRDEGARWSWWIDG